MKFSDAQTQQPRRPLRTVTVPPSAFAQTWADRPTEPIQLGLRTVSSDTDLAEARSLADKRTRELHPNTPETSDVWVEAYNQQLMGAALARAITSAECVDLPYWELQDVVVPRVLTAEGKRMLWLELEALTLQTSPLTPEAPIEDVVRALEERREALAAMPAAERQRVHRLLGAALEALGG